MTSSSLRSAAGSAFVATLWLIRTGLMLDGVIGQDQGVDAVLVLEEIENAFFFQQSRNEIEIGFAILHAVLALQEISVELKLVVLEMHLVEDLLDDIRDLLLLEDAAVGGAREEPQPRDHLGVVGNQVRDPAPPCEKRLMKPLK